MSCHNFHVVAPNAFQREILAKLVTGEHQLLPLVYECEARFPEQPRDLLLRITIGTICGLMRAGLVVAHREIVSPLAERHRKDVLVKSIEVQALAEGGAVAFDEALGCWRLCGNNSPAARIVLRLTERGHAWMN